jgi:hypothetical protein
LLTVELVPSEEPALPPEVPEVEPMLDELESREAS